MPTQDPQDSSLFFQKLPPEIRLDIYSHIFCSTRLSFGKRPTYATGKLSNIRLRPAPNSLSVLRVCRRVNNEIGDSWLGQVLFSFDDPETMLDKLADLDRQTLGKLRHMRYSCEHPLELKTNVIQDGEYEYEGWRYQLPQILKLLRGLRLDRLTVAGESIAQSRYLDLDALINHSDGWKELYYLSNNSVMLGFGKSDKLFGKYEWKRGWRAQQPSTWTQALAARDGPTASVTIYRSTNASSSGSMISKPATRQAFADQEKEILVVARRGKGVDYTENGTSPMMEHDIRKHWPGMTWGQIRYMGIGWHEEELGRDSDADDDGDDDENPFQDIDPGVLRMLARLMRPQLHQDDRPRNSDGAAGTEVDERGCPIKEDTYEHVDDYEWGAYHTAFSPN